MRALGWRTVPFPEKEKNATRNVQNIAPAVAAYQPPPPFCEQGSPPASYPVISEPAPLVYDQVPNTSAIIDTNPAPVVALAEAPVAAEPVSKIGQDMTSDWYATAVHGNWLWGAVTSPDYLVSADIGVAALFHFLTFAFGFVPSIFFAHQQTCGETAFLTQAFLVSFFALGSGIVNGISYARSFYLRSFLKNQRTKSRIENARLENVRIEKAVYHDQALRATAVFGWGLTASMGLAAIFTWFMSVGVPDTCPAIASTMIITSCFVAVVTPLMALTARAWTLVRKLKSERIVISIV